ncbi:MAG: TIGR03663 family protein [Deltaproteobacteria bacterium]|nr:TIGR03663 family protein [Deltaproteobacteria bacterium]
MDTYSGHNESPQAATSSTWTRFAAEKKFPVTAETAAWVILLFLAACLRFYGLGDRAMSHDESLHAYYSYELFKKGIFVHDPMMHGPFLFHLNSAVYYLFGDTDFTARLAPAVLSLGALILIWRLRRYIGRPAALIAGVLLTISPGVLFYSRYIRNEAYLLLFVLLWAWGAFRYLDTRKPRWLYLMILGMTFSFAAKEVSFIYGAIFGGFFVGLACWRAYHHRESIRESIYMDLAILMLTLVMPFITPIGHLLLGWDQLDYTSPIGMRHSGILIGISTAMSVALAVVWFNPVRRSNQDNAGTILPLRHWAGCMFLFWSVLIVLFTTGFTNFPRGIFTGLVGSLGYWLSQHRVARGSQPGYYYFIIIALYEFLPAILSLAALTSVIKKNILKNNFSEHQRYFILFLGWWMLASWPAYTLAGEKMPWLSVHITLPMCLFGAWWLGDWFTRQDWQAAWNKETMARLVLLVLLVVILFDLILILPFQGLDIASLYATNRWVRDLIIAVILLGLIIKYIPQGNQKMRGRVVFAGLLILLTGLTLRYSWMLNYVNYDLATEFMGYADGTPDIKRVLKEIDSISRRTAGERKIDVAYDDDTTWPLHWYMRLYPNNHYYNAKPSPDMLKMPVIIVGSKNYDQVRPLMTPEYDKKTYNLVWWPYQGYFGLNPTRIYQALTDPETRRFLWQVIVNRHYPGVELANWPLRHEFEVYIKRDGGRPKPSTPSPEPIPSTVK